MYTPAHEHPLADYLVDNSASLYAGVVKRSVSKDKMFASNINHEAAVSAVVGLLKGEVSPYGISAVILNDSHLLVYSMGQPWFGGGETWLIEQFYMRVSRGSHTAALSAVDKLGRDLACSRVVFGTSLAANDAALGRLLHTHGYKPQSSQHIKEL